MTWLTWIAARPDGELFAVSDSDGRLRIWSPSENRVVAKQTLPSRIRRAQWTKDGRRIVAIEEGDVLHVFSADGSQREASIATGHGSVHGLSVHPSRSLAATTGDDRHVRVWDLDTGKAILDVAEPSEGTVTSLSEKHLAAGFQSGHFVTWDLETGKDLAGGEIFAGYVASMAFSNDGVSLVCGGSRGSLVAIQSTDWTASAVWKGTPPKPIATNSIEFEARSSRFVCAHSDDTSSLFASTGDTVPTGLGHAFYVDRKPWSQDYIVSSACFVPSAPMILTSHFTGELRVWRGAAGRSMMLIATITFDETSDAPAIAPKLGGPATDPIAWWAEKTGRTGKKRTAPGAAVSWRERVLAEFASSAASATDVGGLGRAAARIPHQSGVKPSAKLGGMLLELTPPIASAELCAFLGWSDNPLRDPAARPRIGAWVVTVPEGGRTGDDEIGKLHLALGAAEATRYVVGHDPWRAPAAPATNEAILAIAKRLLGSKDPPSHVGALEEALGITLDASIFPASGMGRLGFAPHGSVVMNLAARYIWSPYHENPLAKVEDVRPRPLEHWVATFSEGFDALANVLEEELGEPRLRLEHRVYSTWILGGSSGHPCTLAHHRKLPDWAVEPPDAELRARALRDFANAVAAAPNALEVERAAKALPAGAGLVHLAHRSESAQKASLEVELVPAMPALELANVLGWRKPAAQTFAIYQTDWHVRLVTGTRDRYVETTPPRFGRYEVFAGLDARPTGGPYPDVIGGPPGGTHLFAPSDVVRFLRIVF